MNVLFFQAVEELLVELDVDKNSIAVGASRVRTPLELSDNKTRYSK